MGKEVKQENRIRNFKMKRIKMQYCLLLFSIAFIAQSCMSLVQHEKMTLKNTRTNPNVLRLRNYGDEDETLLKKSENLTKGHLFKNEGKEYGYYVLSYKTTQVKNPIGILTGMFFFLIPWGLPTSQSIVVLEAKLYIFDCQGELIREYEDADTFIQTAGLYYRPSSTKRATKKYSRLYDGIFEFATLQADRINKILLTRGPITESNEKAAKENIKNFFKERNESYAKVFDLKKPHLLDNAQQEPSFYSNLSSSHEDFLKLEKRQEREYVGTGNFDITKLNWGLEPGKYHCTLNNLTITMAFGILSISRGDVAIASGSYKVEDKKIIVSFYAGSGYQGKTYTYVIEDSKNFRLEGTDECWLHESIY